MAQQPPEGPMKIFVGGLVTEHEAGHIIAALYRARAERIEHSPLLPLDGHAPQPGIQPGIHHERAQLLPSPSGKAPRGMLPALALVELEKAGKPMAAADIKAAIAAAGYPGDPNIHSAMNNLMDQKKVKRVGVGIYAAIGVKKKAAKARKTKRRTGEGTAPGGITQTEFVLRALKRAHPKPVGNTKLKAMFEKAGLRPESASVALNYLKTQGRATSPATGVYLYVPE